MIGVPEEDWEAAGARIDALIAASASAGTAVRERAEELVRLVADLYGAGLERLLDLVHEHGALTDAALEALADDSLVASLLLVHGLHPHGVETRIERALAGVRPYLGSHGGDVELIGVTADGVVRLRMLGSCDGCPSSSATLTLAVEGAIEAAAPEITGIEVEEPRTQPVTGAMIPVAALFSRIAETPGPGSWTDVSGLAELAPGGATSIMAGAVPVFACRLGAELFAFRDACARCGQSLAGSAPTRRLGGGTGDAVLRCPRCQAHYDVRRAGACLDEDALHLSPLPLLAESGSILVAVPVPVPT